MKDFRFELSVFIGLAVALLCAVITPPGLTGWWTVAFEPLCDGVLTRAAEGETIVLRSALWEWLLSLQ